MSKPQENNLAEAWDCVLWIVCMVAIFIGVFVLRIESVKNMAKEMQKDLTTQYGYAIGKVKTVETWKADKFIRKEGNMTLTLDITDRCKVVFEDGRSKEMIGMPKTAIPTNKEVAIIWSKYDLFLEAVDAEEFKKRKPKEENTP